MKKIDISQVLTEGVDVANRRVYFASSSEKTSEFDWSSVEATIRAIHVLCSESSDPIELHMASLGGSEYDMSRLYDTIQTCPAPIIFIGSGYIMSAAVWIMSGCDYRMLHENTEIMIHEGSGGMDEAATHVDQEIMLEANKKRNSKWWDILSQNSRMPKSFWEFVGKRDLYISAHEAVELGLADKVITHPDRSQYRDYRNNKLNKKMPKAKTSQLVAKMLNRVKQDKTKFDIK